MTLAVVGALAAIPASASVVYTFTNDHCTGSCLPLTDSITVTQNGANSVNVSVTGSDWGFVSTGAGGTGATNGSFFFNLLNNPTIAVTNLTSGWTLISTTAGTLAGDGFSGEMEYGLNCGTCSGASPKLPPLNFTVTAAGLTEASFNDPGLTPVGDRAYFVADVINLTNSVRNGNTGLVGATPSTSSVPEPISLSLVGGGLLALGLFRKRFVA